MELSSESELFIYNERMPAFISKRLFYQYFVHLYYYRVFFCILSTPFYLKTVDPTRFFLNDCNHPFKWWIDNINIKNAFYELFINEPVPPFLTTIFEKLEFAIFNFWFWHNIIKINATIQCLWVCKGYLISISSIWGHYN